MIKITNTGDSSGFKLLELMLLRMGRNHHTMIQGQKMRHFIPLTMIMMILNQLCLITPVDTYLKIHIG